VCRVIIVWGFPEGFTTERVSALARRAWLEYRRGTATVTFQPCRDGYAMTAWESQIDSCRDDGAARARALGRPVHRFDARRTAYSAWRRQQGLPV